MTPAALTNLPAIDDLLKLLAIQGPPGQEHDVADHLQQVLVGIGVPAATIVRDSAHLQSEYGGSTGNLIVRLDGHGRGPRRMLSAHMDTVPLAVGAVAALDGDRVVNRAAGKALGGDNRTGCAALLQAARALVARGGAHGPVTLVFFVQEEVGLVGARGLNLELLGEPRPALCFNFDGSQADELVTAVIGTERFTIDVTGVAAHAGLNPADGVSAAVLAADAIAELARTGWHGAIAKPAGRGSANVGIIKGGSGSNVVMPALHLLVEARSHDCGFRKAIIAEWQAAFHRAATAWTNRAGTCGQVRFGPGPTYEAFAMDADSLVVRTALAAAANCGIVPRCVSNDGGMDANWVVAHGIPALTIGVGQHNVHTPDEFIDLDAFALACRLARELATCALPT